MYGNPVVGYVRPPGSPRLVGSFRVTAPFGSIDPSHPTPHGGVDIGNGLCGDPIFACEAGKVTLAGLLGAAKVVRIVHANGEESGYAHLASITAGITVGVTVKRGQQIGTLGSTGATACHLHLGLKDRVGGSSIDIWPKLEQNLREPVDCSEAVTAATAPLQVRIDAAKTALG